MWQSADYLPLQAGTRRQQWQLAVLAALLMGAASLEAMRGGRMPHGPFGPDVPGDTQDYDCIAWNLAHGRGFATDWTDREFREPYERHNSAGMYDSILARRTGLTPTTYSPPAYPALLAATYVVSEETTASYEPRTC